MNTRSSLHFLLPLSTLLLACSLSSQTVRSFPAGTDQEWGGTGNTIPFWGGSATYQQVHDIAAMSAMTGGKIMIVNRMFFRARGNIKARSATVQLKFNQTSTSSATATGFFATNLQAPGDGAATTVIKYRKMNFPAFNGAGGPGKGGTMDLPLDTLYIWTPRKKNFVLELRYKDGSPGVQTGSLDAVDGNTFTQSRRPSEGTGCLASGQTRTASASSTLAFARGSSSFPVWTYSVNLTSARARTNAIWFAGVARQKTTLPGMCGSLLLQPLFSLAGMTTAPTGGGKPRPGGTWNVRIPVPRVPEIRLLPRFELLSQFVFADASLRYDMGVSSMTVVKTSFPGAMAVARIFSFRTGAGNGSELATSGSKGSLYGLVTGFR